MSREESAERLSEIMRNVFDVDDLTNLNAEAGWLREPERARK
jgi:hypothetical protein